MPRRPGPSSTGGPTISTPSRRSAATWPEKHFPLLKQGIRINAICPGPTERRWPANEEMWLGFGADYREEAGIGPSTPLEQAYPLVFLCSDAAAGITGIT